MYIRAEQFDPNHAVANIVNGIIPGIRYYEFLHVTKLQL